MNLTTILDDCLTRLAAGESVAQCLARYPEAAPMLAPMLAAAEQARAFSAVRLSEGQRLRAKVALREELATQQARRHQTAFPLGVAWPRWRFAPLAALLAVVLFSTVAFSAVAATQPGDLAYPARIAVERATVWFQFSASGRVAAELALAERRLAEVMRAGKVHPVTLEALLRSDAAAIERAESLTEAERAEVAARVAKHADELAQLAAQSADPGVSAALIQAAGEAETLASRLVVVVPAPANTPTATASLWPTQSPTPQPSSTPLPVVVPAISVTPPAIPTIPTPVVPTIPPIPTVVVPTVVVPTVPPFTVPPVITGTPWPKVTPVSSWTPRVTLPPLPTAFPTFSPFPTVAPFPTLEPFPTAWPFPTGIVTQSVETPVAPTAVVPTVIVPTISAPTVTVPTVVIPTIAVPTIGAPPTIRPPGAQLTATVVWLTMTPPATPTPRPDLRLTVTLTVVLPRATRTPEPTQTPAPSTEAPGPTATQAGQLEPTSTAEAVETAMPAATPMLPPMPR